MQKQNETIANIVKILEQNIKPEEIEFMERCMELSKEIDKIANTQNFSLKEWLAVLSRKVIEVCGQSLDFDVAMTAFNHGLDISTNFYKITQEKENE